LFVFLVVIVATEVFGGYPAWCRQGSTQDHLVQGLEHFFEAGKISTRITTICDVSSTSGFRRRRCPVRPSA
jgi:hypothetical protein